MNSIRAGLHGKMSPGDKKKKKIVFFRFCRFCRPTRKKCRRATKSFFARGAFFFFVAFYMGCIIPDFLSPATSKKNFFLSLIPDFLSLFSGLKVTNEKKNFFPKQKSEVFVTKLKKNCNLENHEISHL